MMQYFEVPSVDNSLRKAVLDGIVNKLLQESGIEEAEIVYSDDDTDTRAQAGSRIGTDRGVSYGVNNKCLVEFSETRNVDNRHNRGVGLNREVPVFYDKKHSVQLQPVMTQYDVELTITRNSASKDILQRWVNRLDSLIDMGRASNVFDVESFYYIPMPALELLHAVYETLNEVDRQDASYHEYLKKHLHKSVTVLAGQSGSQKRLAGRYNSTRIEVVYDTTPPSRERNDLQHSARLNVSFSYMRPDEMQCSYPVTMRQALIAEKWRPREDPTYLSNDELAELSNVQYSYDEIAKWGMVRLPFWEGGKDTLEKVVTPRPNTEAPIWGVDVTFPNVDTKPVPVLGWDDLPFVWDDDVKKYIDKCIALDPTGKNCIINFIVYIGGYPCKPGDLSWGADGTLTLNIDIEIDVQYYLVHRFILDWRVLEYKDILILRDFPDALNKFIDWIVPDVKKPEVLPSGKVDWEEFDRVVESFTPEGFPDHTWLTVFNTSIMTFKKER